MPKQNIHISTYMGRVNLKVTTDTMIFDILLAPEEAYYVARDLGVEASSILSIDCTAEAAE